MLIYRLDTWLLLSAPARVDDAFPVVESVPAASVSLLIPTVDPFPEAEFADFLDGVRYGKTELRSPSLTTSAKDLLSAPLT